MSDYLEVKLINLKLAMQHKKPKKFISAEFKDYLEEYNNKEKDVVDKTTYRDVSMEYQRHMMKSGDTQ